MTIFTESFWGEKNQGFACLYNNMKHGQTSTKELAEFFKERALIEDNYHKSVSKLAKSTSSCSQLGTFAPFWTVFKAATDKLSSSHHQLVQKLQDIVKEIQKYGDEQHKKHKTVKIEVQSTAEVVTNIQQTTDAVARAKELYNTKCIEFEKLKREGITGKELEKAETKYKKSLEDYKNLIDKYGNLREDFQKKMSDTCQKFEALEEAHLQQLKDFIKQYNIAVGDCHTSVQKVQREFTEQCEDLTETKLISMFSETKGTGKEKPVLLEFEECDVSNIPMPDHETTKKKKKPKKVKKKKEKDGESPGNSPDMQQSSNSSEHSGSIGNASLSSFKDSVSSSAPQVDAEGFSIKPEDNRVDVERRSLSDSDKSDSDSEGEDRTRRIRVEIKPRENLPQTTATVDQIKASLGGITLSPTQKRKDRSNGDIHARRTALNRSSVGMSPTHYSRVYRNSWLRFSNQSNSAGNLLDLDLDFNSFSMPSGPMSPARNHNSNTTTPDNLLHSPTTLGDSLPPALPAKQRHSIGSTFAAATVSIPALPARPPSRGTGRMQSPTLTGSTSPDGLPRQDSNSSLSGPSPFNATTVVGGSRGPSPLTLGHNDTIPLAAAFSESVNAYFKGNDQSKCMVKITGDLMVSFPAGIIQVLTSNPQPAILAFRIKNTSQLEHVLPNKQLISVDTLQTTNESTAYIFNMSNLVTLLKHQVEKNANASYFNVDILKYQVKAEPEGKSTPLQLCSYWKCEPTTTDLRVDYAYNPSAMDKAKSLINVSLIVPVDGGVTVMQSKPAATWSSESKRVLWKIGEIPPGGEPGSLRARFELSEGPSKPATLAVQFSSEGATLSGVEIELLNTFYRLSLVKKRFCTGKYLSES